MTRTGAWETQLAFDAALERTGPEWTAEARHVVAAFCAVPQNFTAEDLRDVVGDPPGSPNALGALLHAIAEEGWITEVGTTRSRRPSSHGRRLVRWGPSA